MHLLPCLVVALATLLAVPVSAAAATGTCVGQIELQMQKERTGHVSVRLSVNGVEARLLVDTGANVNTLDTTEGRRAKPEVIPYPESLPGEGHATLTLGYGPLSLGPQQFSIMDLGFINIPSKRFGTESFMGQLGASFFSDYKAKIDFDRMILCISIPESQR